MTQKTNTQDTTPKTQIPATDERHPCFGCKEWRCYRGYIHGHRADMPCQKIAGTGFIPKS